MTISRWRSLKSGWLVRELRTMKRGVQVHTLNDEREMSRYLSLGVTGVYTDDYVSWAGKGQ